MTNAVHSLRSIQTANDMTHAHSEPERFQTRLTNGEHVAFSDTTSEAVGANGRLIFGRP